MVREGNDVLESATDEVFTKESVATLYEEAKVMVEELIDDAKAKAEQILIEARNNAKKITDNAKLQAEEIKADAYDEGFKDGEKAGLLKVEGLKKQANMLIATANKERQK